MSTNSDRPAPPSAGSLAGLAGLAELIAPGSSVAAMTPLAGSFAHYSHLLELRAPGGPGSMAVVKRYAGPRDSAVAKAVLEYKTLEMLRGSGIPAPEPLYLDAEGDMLGIPGIVMTQMPGRQVVAPPDFIA